MAAGKDDEGREEFLAENRARRAKIRADEESKAKDAKAVDERDADPVSDVGADVDAEADAEADTAADTDPDGAASRTARRSRAVMALTAVSVILAAAVAVLGYLLVRADADSDAGVDTSVTETAADYATTVLSYSAGDYSELDKRIRAISTPEFADRYIASSQQARQGNDEAQASGTAEAKASGLISLSDSKAVVLVAIDQSVRSPLVPSAEKEGLDYQSRVQITLTRDGDDWKLSDLSVI